MKKANVIYWVIFVVVLATAAVFVFSTRSDQAATNTNQDSATTTPPTTAKDTDSKTPAEQQFTAAQIAEHDNKDDCWTIINGTVYNLTSYINRHPGGDEIVRACGKDGSTLFNSRTTDEGEKIGSGSGHSGSAKAQLEQLKVGTVKP